MHSHGDRGNENKESNYTSYRHGMTKKTNPATRTPTSAHPAVSVDRRGRETRLSLGGGATQSAAVLDDPSILPLAYTRFIMLACVLTPRLDSVLHIGLGGGTMLRFLDACFPGLRQLAIEINPEVIAAAQRDFRLGEVAGLELLHGDAIALLPTLGERFDVIFLDAFEHDKTPEGLITPRSLRELGLHLNSDGWLAANVYADTLSLRALHRRWREAFAQVWQIRDEPLFWPVLFAACQNNALSFADLIARARDLERIMPLPLTRMVAGLVPLSKH